MPDQRLHALAAVDEALKDPVRVLQTVTASADFDDALPALQDSWLFADEGVVSAGASVTR